MKQTQTSRQIEDMTDEEWQDLKDYLKLGYMYDKDRVGWFICIESRYKHKQNKELVYIFNIECSIPYLPYHIWFRERELERLGFEQTAFRTKRFRFYKRQKILQIFEREIQIAEKLSS